MNLILRAKMVEMIADADPSKRWMSRWLEVVPSGVESTKPRLEMCVPRFRLMCSALHRVTASVQACDAVLADIERVEGGVIETAGRGLDEYAVDFTKDGAVFWFEHAAEGEETGGRVSLMQLKLAILTYRQFLNDPDRKLIEVAFPDV